MSLEIFKIIKDYIDQLYEEYEICCVYETRKYYIVEIEVITNFESCEEIVEFFYDKDSKQIIVKNKKDEGADEIIKNATVIWK